MTEQLTVYRRSQLQAVDEGCLFRLNAIWNEGIDDTSDPALTGIGFHAVKHRYILKLVEARLNADAELAAEAFVEGVGAVQTPSRLIPDLRQLWMFHAEKYELDLKRFVTTEEKGASGQVGFTPDLVLATPEINELEIQDDKSGWQPPMSEEELKMLFQARVYIRYARDRWPNYSRYRFTLNAIRFNKSISVVFSDAELDQIDVEVKAHIATIERAAATNHWPAVAGPACRYCELQCPLMQQTVTVPKRLATVEQARGMAEWITAGQAVIKAAKKSLKGWVSAYGPIDVNGVVWANRTAEVRLYPIDVVLEVLKLRNFDGVFENAKVHGLTISHSALAKLFKQFPMLEDDLKNYVITRPSNRFSAKQPGEEEDDE